MTGRNLKHGVFRNKCESPAVLRQSKSPYLEYRRKGHLNNRFKGLGCPTVERYVVPPILIAPEVRSTAALKIPVQVHGSGSGGVSASAKGSALQGSGKHVENSASMLQCKE